MARGGAAPEDVGKLRKASAHRRLFTLARHVYDYVNVISLAAPAGDATADIMQTFVKIHTAYTDAACSAICPCRHQLGITKRRKGVCRICTGRVRGACVECMAGDFLACAECAIRGASGSRAAVAKDQEDSGGAIIS